MMPRIVCYRKSVSGFSSVLLKFLDKKASSVLYVIVIRRASEPKTCICWKDWPLCSGALIQTQVYCITVPLIYKCSFIKWCHIVLFIRLGLHVTLRSICKMSSCCHFCYSGYKHASEMLRCICFVMLMLDLWWTDLLESEAQSVLLEIKHPAIKKQVRYTHEHTHTRWNRDYVFVPLTRTEMNMNESECRRFWE